MEDAADPGEETTGKEALAALARLAAGFGAFVVIVSLAAWRFRAELEHAGRTFVDHFGAVGMAAGAFLADGLHFPVPPQFYLLAAIADGTSRGTALASVVAGSTLGGLVAFALGRTAAGTRFARGTIRTTRVHAERLLAKRGTLGLVVAGMLPVSYWLLCTMAGALRLPWRAYAVLAIMRVPRLVLSYALIIFAWSAAP